MAVVAMYRMAACIATPRLTSSSGARLPRRRRVGSSVLKNCEIGKRKLKHLSVLSPGDAVARAVYRED